MIRACINNDNILPSQFFPTARNHSGYQRLLMAIFDEALTTLQWTFTTTHNHRADILWNKAVEWVLSNDERYASFIFCCHHLGADPSSVQQALREQYTLELRIPYRQPFPPRKKNWRSMEKLSRSHQNTPQQPHPPQQPQQKG